MKNVCICLVAGLWSFLGIAQSNLYLSPERNKTANNSIVVTPEGNVGIGKANPEAKLEVNGRVHAKSVKVDLEGWADYVFEPDYDLPTLTEVEAYVKTYGHLPGVPSEREMVEEGLDVVEANLMLMEKVEELTLYLIQKEKEVKSLEARLSKLEAKLNE